MTEKKSDGRLLAVVGKCDNIEKLNSETGLEQMLLRICDTIGMRPLDRLSVQVPVELHRLNAEPKEDEGGASAVVILSTSHAAVHGWPARRHFRFELSSCREFDSGHVCQMLTQELDATVINILADVAVYEAK